MIRDCKLFDNWNLATNGSRNDLWQLVSQQAAKGPFVLDTNAYSTYTWSVIWSVERMVEKSTWPTL